MTTPYEVREIAGYERDTWDEFVSTSQAGTLYHTSLWQTIINNSYGDGEYKLIAAFDNNRIVGGFCALVRRRLGVETAVTPLCTPYTGYITNPGDSTSGTCEVTPLSALSTYLDRYRYQNIQCAPGVTDHPALKNLGYAITPRRTLEINLRLPEGELWSTFNSNVRRNIRKAQKGGFEITDQWDAERGYKLFCDTFIRHGQRCPVASPFFDAICRGSELEEYRRRYCAWKDGVLLAFIIALRYNDVVYYELAAADVDALKTGVSSLLIWELLRDHLNGEFDHFDFVGGNNPSISRFKENFAPTAKPHLQIEKCLSRRIGWGRGVRRWLRRG